MIRRRTQRQALTVARAALMQAETANAAGKQQITHDWIGVALRGSADTLPIDMAQLGRLARAYRPAACGYDAALLADFLKFCKDNAK